MTRRLDLQNYCAFFWPLLMVLFWTTESFAQQRSLPPPTESDTAKLITIIRADQGVGQRAIGSQKLIGDVILRQDSVVIFCDSARLVANRVQADGRVAIVQYDTIKVFAQRAFYDGNDKTGFLYGDTVILENGNQRLFAKDSLYYDLGQKIAYYTSGAILIQDSTYIVSKRGSYFLDLDDMLFENEVVVKDSGFVLVADSLRYNTTTKIVTFISPTRITTDSSKIYCEAGEYNLVDKKGFFSGNPQFDNGTQQSTADVIEFDQRLGDINLIGNAKVTDVDQYAEANRIYYSTKTEDIELIGNAYFRDGEDEVSGQQVIYNKESKTYRSLGRSKINSPPMIIEADTIAFDDVSGMGEANGNVIWRDTSANSTIFTEHAEYIQEQNYLLAYGDRPIFASDVEGDSLYVSADTLLNEQRIIRDTILKEPDTLDLDRDTLHIETDTLEMLKAYYDVRIFKSNFQALCDSLNYSQKDSLFYLYRDPIVWSDTSQFVADTIKIKMSNDQIDRIWLINNAFIINSPDEVLFNQVKGRLITAYFEEGEISRMHVEGNAEAIYYALDEEGRYIGVNKTVSSEMMLFFEQNEIVRIKFIGPDANLLPIQSTDHEGLKIDGFNWKIENRPRTIADL